MSQPRLHSTRRIALPLLIGILSAGYFFWYIHVYSQYPFDDTFIHLRIARNFAEHGVPYYNPDEEVRGTSSLLFTLLLAAIFKMIGPDPAVLPHLAFVFTCGVFILCSLLLSERMPLTLSVLAAASVTAACLLDTASGLMETPFALLLFLLSVWAWRKRSFTLLGLFAALAFMTRYEYALWLATVFLLAEGAKARRDFVVGALPPAACMALFDLYYFGTLIPNTVLAKSKVFQLTMGEFVERIGAGWPGFVLLVAGAATLIYLAFRRQEAAWVKAMTAFPALLFGLYFLRSAFMFPWYWPLITLPLALSLFFAFKPGGARAPFIVSMLALLTLSARPAYGLVTGQFVYCGHFEQGARVRQYLKIGADLYREHPDAVLATSEIGGLGWSFRGKIVDAVGLVSPALLKYHPMKVPDERSSGSLGSIPPGAVREAAPDLLVSMEIFTEAFRREVAEGRFPDYSILRRYPVVGEVDARLGAGDTLWDSKFIEVYVRGPHAQPAPADTTMRPAPLLTSDSH